MASLKNLISFIVYGLPPRSSRVSVSSVQGGPCDAGDVYSDHNRGNKPYDMEHPFGGGPGPTTGAEGGRAASQGNGDPDLLNFSVDFKS